MSERTLTTEQLRRHLENEADVIGIGLSFFYWVADKKRITSWRNKDKMEWACRRVRCIGCKEMIERGEIVVIVRNLEVRRAWPKPMNFHFQGCFGAFLRTQLQQMEQEILKGARFIEKYNL